MAPNLGALATQVGVHPALGARGNEAIQASNQGSKVLVKDSWQDRILLANINEYSYK